MLRAARRLGELRDVQVATTFLGAHALPPDYAGDADAYIAHVVDAMLPEVVRLDLADAVDAFCETIGFTAAQTERLFEAATCAGLPVKPHAEQLSNQHGAALAARVGALSAAPLEYLAAAGVSWCAWAGTDGPRAERAREGRG